MDSDVRALARWCSDRAVPAVTAATALAVTAVVGGPLLLGQDPGPSFLVANLVLAWVPYLAALRVEALGRRRKWLDAVVYGIVWLLFLPNGPYLVSDFAHFDPGSATPWLDLGTLFAFGWAGLLLGVVSMRLVHHTIERELGRLAAWAAVLVAAGASGFGVALGRFGRVNSWEVVTEPSAVTAQVTAIATDGRLLAVGAFFAALLLAVYTAGPAIARPRLDEPH